VICVQIVRASAAT